MRRSSSCVHGRSDLSARAPEVGGRRGAGRGRRTHLDPVLELDLLGLERAQVVRVLAEAQLGLAQLVDVRLPVVEDADARVELLRARGRASSAVCSAGGRFCEDDDKERRCDARESTGLGR